MIEEIRFSPKTKVTWDKVLKTVPQKAPFFDYRWHASWYKTAAKQSHPYFFLVNKNVIAAFEKSGTTLIFSGGKEVADYADFIGTEANKKAALPALIAYLKDHGITHITLENVPQDSQTLLYFQTIATSLPHCEIKTEDTTPKLILPTTWEEYLGTLSRKHRHELRRKVRKFQENNPKAHYVRSADTLQDSEQLFMLMRQDARKRAFFDSKMEAFFKELLRTFPKEAIIDFICVDNNCAATIFCFYYNKTVFLYNSGLDIRRYPGAGFYLKAKSIEKAIENNMKEYNFLQGNERYKYELGGKNFLVYTINAQLA